MALLKVSPHLQKTAHMRAVMILVASVMVALLVVLLTYGMQLKAAQEKTLVNQSNTQASVVPVDDKDTPPQQSVFAPDLVSLLNLNVEKAVESLGHGATVTEILSTYDKAGTLYLVATVPLGSLPADGYAGTPTVYLTMTADYKVVEAGFYASMSYLGYGRLSFIDAVENAHVVENTLQEAGLFVETGTVHVPEDKADYATYTSDGVTLDQERYEFTGTSDGHPWRAVVTYDYSLANSTDNLARTIRTIAVYVHA